MEMNKYIKAIETLDPQKQYVLACSFGPDSMCLFDLLVKAKIQFVVAHVNYHRRKEANVEESALRAYCDKLNIPFFLKHSHYQKSFGNFQSWAREKRYEFFEEVYNTNDADGLLIAHQQDDHIETYLIQKERNTKVFHYGILRETTILGMNVLRPLFDLAKKETEEYCVENNVPYAIDASNLTPVYTRNKIRLEVVQQMNEVERQEILAKIDRANLDLVTRKKELDDIFEPYLHISMTNLHSLNEEDLYYVFYKMLTRHIKPRDFNQKLFAEILKMLSSKKPNMTLHLDKRNDLMKEYGRFYVADLSVLHPYEIMVSFPQTIHTEYFRVTLEKDMPHRNIKASDWPITIRNPRPFDQYTIKDYSSDLRRLFIDWKMPTSFRKIWPVFLNKNKKIIYVPRYRDDYKPKKKNDLEIFFPHFKQD